MRKLFSDNRQELGIEIKCGQIVQIVHILLYIFNNFARRLNRGERDMNLLFGGKRLQDDEQEQRKPYNPYTLFLILILLLLSEKALLNIISLFKLNYLHEAG